MVLVASLAAAVALETELFPEEETFLIKEVNDVPFLLSSKVLERFAAVGLPPWESKARLEVFVPPFECEVSVAGAADCCRNAVVVVADTGRHIAVGEVQLSYSGDIGV